jgi:hypothetical protein
VVEVDTLAGLIARIDVVDRVRFALVIRQRNLTRKAVMLMMLRLSTIIGRVRYGKDAKYHAW